MAKHILLVETDDLLRQALAEQLRGQGFTVDEAGSADDALRRLAGESADLVLVGGPMAGGVADFCGALRGDGLRCPIVALGLGAGEQQAALAAGASECIAKPFRFAHLLQRMQAHLRDQPCEVRVRIGTFQFHPLGRMMTDGAGNRIRLTEKEAAILTYLHQAGERVVSRDELLGKVWGYASAASTHTVETHIYRLRRKLEDGRGGDALLRTEQGGYRLAAAP